MVDQVDLGQDPGDPVVLQHDGDLAPREDVDHRAQGGIGVHHLRAKIDDLCNRLVGRVLAEGHVVQKIALTHDAHQVASVHYWHLRDVEPLHLGDDVHLPVGGLGDDKLLERLGPQEIADPPLHQR